MITRDTLASEAFNTLLDIAVAENVVPSNDNPCAEKMVERHEVEVGNLDTLTVGEALPDIVALGDEQTMRTWLWLFSFTVLREEIDTDWIIEVLVSAMDLPNLDRMAADLIRSIFTQGLPEEVARKLDTLSPQRSERFALFVEQQDIT